MLGAGIEVSRFLRLGNRPVGLILDQPDFLNAAVRIRTPLEPEELLDLLKEIERAIGRRTGRPRHSPRVIDIDLLLMGDLEYESDRRRLPHREVTSRRFVLAPLLELGPGLTLPDGVRRQRDGGSRSESRNRRKPGRGNTGPLRDSDSSPLRSGCRFRWSAR
ncbi:MAG: 2-amino-4-hydroxy-6-hydroxymethyldihydropteridine diphosphokinase [Dehalococcoidia bacterium]|nr:2-amino-4-hydroxy-6-hydroxymethyldihydropteridine diphosphokinase [Dehalococcoidia bacterium]